MVRERLMEIQFYRGNGGLNVLKWKGTNLKRGYQLKTRNELFRWEDRR
jgi:hypothetical protein